MKQLMLFALLAMSLPMFAQTSNYTVTQDGCGAKNLGYCQLNIVDQASTSYRLVLDKRIAANGPINTLTITNPDYPYTSLLSVH